MKTPGSKAAPKKNAAKKAAPKKDKEKELAAREQALNAREEAVAAREKKAGIKPEKKRELTKAQQALIDKGCEAYGINPEYVLASNFDEATGEAVIVTNGGSKVRYSEGMKVKPLSQIAITGVNPENKRRKPVAGKKKD